MFRLQKIANLQPKRASEVKCSRLGIGFEKLDRAVFDPEKAYDKLANIGVKWVRIQSGWARTEKEKGVYDFAWLDGIVDNLIARGLKPWMCVCYGNGVYDELAQKIFGAVGCPPVRTEQQKTAWSNYCHALAKHYKGRVEHFEVWNEPDRPYSWKPQVNATELGEFTIATAKALKAGNEDAFVIGCPVCDPPISFLNEAFQTGVGKYIDALSFHEYTCTEDNVRQKVFALRGISNMYAPGLEIVQGESGAQSKFGGHGALRECAWTEKKQAKILLRHLVMDLLCGVKFTSYFSCLDMIEALHGLQGDVASYLDYGYFGVLSADFDENGFSTGEYSPKPSYYALQNLASLLSGDVQEMELPVFFERFDAPHTWHTKDLSSNETNYGGFRLDNGAYAVAYWKSVNLMTTEFEGTVTLDCAVLGKKAKLVDPMDGSVYEIPDEIAIADGHGGYQYKHLPVRDYPLFLVFGDLP